MEPNLVFSQNGEESIKGDALFPLVVSHLNRIGLPFTWKHTSRTTTLLISFREEESENGSGGTSRPAGTNA